MTEHPARSAVVTLLGTGIVKAHVTKLDRAPGIRAPGWQRTFRCRFQKERTCIENIEQARHRRGAALEEVDHPPQRDERPGEQSEIAPKGDERADAYGTADRQGATDPQQRKLAEPRE